MIWVFLKVSGMSVMQKSPNRKDQRTLSASLPRVGGEGLFPGVAAALERLLLPSPVP